MSTQNYVTTGLASATGTAPPGALTKTDNPTAAAVPTTYRWGAADIQPTLGAIADISTYLNSVIDLQSYGADPTGVADCHTALVNAYTAAAAGNGVVQIRAGTFKLGTNTTVPAGVTLWFVGGLINVANGVTLTVTHAIQASPTAQIFAFNASPSATPVAYSVGPVSPMWWGAKGDGSTDDTAAIEQCFAGCGNLEVTPPDMDDVEFVVPEIHFPARKFNVSTVLELPFGAFVTGEGNACLFGTSSSNDILTSTGSYFRARIDGLSVIGGQNGLTVTGNDLDMDTVYVTRCTFSGQAAYAFNMSRFSTQVVADQCNLRNQNSAGGILNGACDEFTVIDSWVTHACAKAFNFVGSFSGIRISGTSNNTSSGTWFYCTGGAELFLYSCRFGGENGGSQLLYWKGSTVTDPLANISSYQYGPGVLNGAVVVEDTNCFSSGQFIMNFQDLPAQLRIVNCQGFGDSNGVHFDTAIPLAARAALGYGYGTGLDYAFGGNGEANWISVEGTSDPEVVDRVLFASGDRKSDYALPLTSDAALTFDYTNGGLSSSVAGTITTTDTTNVFGAPVVSGAASSSGGAWSEIIKNATSGMAAGPYTAVFDLQITAGSVTASFYAGENSTNLTLPLGHHLVHVPFYINSNKASPTAWAASTSYSVGNVRESGAGGTFAPHAVWQCILAGTSAGSGGPGSTSGNLVPNSVSDAPGAVLDGPNTTVAAGSTNTTLNVTSNSGFASSGSAWVATSAGYVSVAYTGKGTNTLTGCTGLTAANLITGGVVLQGVMWAWIGNQSIGWSATLGASATMVFGPVRVFANHPAISTINTVMLGSAAPSGSIQAYIGDVTTNTAPIAGGFEKWICTAAGAPGTWKASGSISS